MRIITSVAPLYCIPDLEMKTPRLLLLCHLTLGLSLARELRRAGDYDYDYDYGNNEDWSESQDYNYTYWADQEHPVEQRGQAFWRAECRAWSSKEIFLQGDKEWSLSDR